MILWPVSFNFLNSLIEISSTPPLYNIFRIWRPHISDGQTHSGISDPKEAKEEYKYSKYEKEQNNPNPFIPNEVVFIM